ncbi:hypothetical protein AWN90_19660 [Nocardia terpenica]|uniref:Bacterial Ig domain-containing protein n=1 Tax=Nocardia terpenica TaxID=455432 RepID=A0A164PHV9_9NOCA|nr:hypothetical protein AWN90_19660 [Nocardia terpenica]
MRGGRLDRMQPTSLDSIRVVYGSVLVNHAGRLAERAVLGSLGWVPGTPIRITTVPPVEGAFYWVTNREVRWRPENFWAPGTRITVDVNTYGRDLGRGLIGDNDIHASFTVGDATIFTAGDQQHTGQAGGGRPDPDRVLHGASIRDVLVELHGHRLTDPDHLAVAGHHPGMGALERRESGEAQLRRRHPGQTDGIGPQPIRAAEPELLAQPPGPPVGRDPALDRVTLRCEQRDTGQPPVIDPHRQRLPRRDTDLPIPDRKHELRPQQRDHRLPPKRLTPPRPRPTTPRNHAGGMPESGGTVLCHRTLAYHRHGCGVWWGGVGGG